MLLSLALRQLLLCTIKAQRVEDADDGNVDEEYAEGRSVAHEVRPACDNVACKVELPCQRPDV